jgi:hypothetical protein
VALRFPPHSTNAVLSPQAKVVVADRCKTMASRFKTRKVRAAYDGVKKKGRGTGRAEVGGEITFPVTIVRKS